MWFSNKKKGNSDSLSSLPELPDLPELPESYPKSSSSSGTPRDSFMPSRSFPESKELAPMSYKESMHPLPSFPNSDTANKMSREAIKSALESPPRGKYSQETDFSGQKEGEEETEEAEEFSPPAFIPQFRPRAIEKSEPIFVRLDRFQSAIKNLSEIKKQISEIESGLAEIKNIKEKEEEELQAWENEILNLKSKLESADKSLLDKLD